MIRLTASGLARVEACPASASLPHTERVHADAAAGTEAHAVREAQETRPGYRSEVALALNVLTGEARELPKAGHREYPDLGEGWIYGQTDTLAVEEQRVVIEDFKSGGGYDAHAEPLASNIQLGFYALAAATAHEVESATVRIVRTEGTTSEHTHDGMALLALEERIRRIYQHAHDAEPRVVEGDHCWRCPALTRCPAKVALAIGLSAGVDQRLFPTLELTQESVARGWTALKRVKQVLAQIEGAYRSYAAGEDVALPDGKVLGTIKKSRREIDAGVAYAVLSGEYAQDVALAGVTMEASQASIKRALASVVDKGQGAAELRRVLALIEQAGGVATKTTHVVEEHAARGTLTEETRP